MNMTKTSKGNIQGLDPRLSEAEVKSMTLRSATPMPMRKLLMMPM
jgi:hypothetical protein